MKARNKQNKTIQLIEIKISLNINKGEERDYQKCLSQWRIFNFQ